MRKLICLILLCGVPLLAQAAADDITGVWLTAAGDGYVQIFEEDGEYYGKTVGSPPGEREPGRKDTNNPDPEKRDRELLGIRVLKGFEYDGEGRWEDGRAYDPDNGKTYDAWMALKSPDELKLRGYIGISLLGRTEIWTRVAPEAEGVEASELVKSE